MDSRPSRKQRRADMQALVARRLAQHVITPVHPETSAHAHRAWEIQHPRHGEHAVVVMTAPGSVVIYNAKDILVFFAPNHDHRSLWGLLEGLALLQEDGAVDGLLKLSIALPGEFLPGEVDTLLRSLSNGGWEDQANDIKKQWDEWLRANDMIAAEPPSEFLALAEAWKTVTGGALPESCLDWSEGDLWLAHVLQWFIQALDGARKPREPLFR